MKPNLNQEKYLNVNDEVHGMAFELQAIHSEDLQWMAYSIK